MSQTLVDPMSQTLDESDHETYIGPMRHGSMSGSMSQTVDP